MNEPTKEAIEEALYLREKFAGGPVVHGNNLAELIANVRKQARDDALEAAANEFDALDSQRPNSVVLCRGAATRVRALKTQGDTQ